MSRNGFNPGIRRRQIEDSILQQFSLVDFSQKNHAYLEEENFWDYVFAWYDLVKYYDDGDDTAIGKNMLDLYAISIERVQAAMQDRQLRDRRRDRAHNAIYQMNYYLNQIVRCVERNALIDDDSIGQLP